MRLYGYWRSTSTWRVRIVLRFKGVAHEYQAVDLLQDGGEQYAPGYVEKNPFSQVPVLEWQSDGQAVPVRRLGQSMAILEYLEERFPSPALLPPDPWLRGRARQLAEIVNSGIQPYQNNPSVLGYVKETLRGDARAWARHFIERGLRALERTAEETAGSFLVGDAPTFADVFLVPQLYAARRFDVDLQPLPLLRRVEAACLVLPAFAEAHPDRQPDAPQG